MLSLLRLNSVELEKVSIKAGKKGLEQAGSEAYTVTLTHEIDEAISSNEEKCLQLRLRLVPEKGSLNNQIFEEIDVIIRGKFSFCEEITEELKKKLFPLTAISMLFGVVRGIIVQSTGMFPSGSFMLPPVNIVDAAKKKRLTATCSLVRMQDIPTQNSVDISAGPRKKK